MFSRGMHAVATTVMLVMEGTAGRTKVQSERVDEATKAMDVMTTRAAMLSHGKRIWRKTMVPM
jgi:hypothetical protein